MSKLLGGLEREAGLDMHYALGPACGAGCGMIMYGSSEPVRLDIALFCLVTELIVPPEITPLVPGNISPKTLHHELYARLRDRPRPPCQPSFSWRPACRLIEAICRDEQLRLTILETACQSHPAVAGEIGMKMAPILETARIATAVLGIIGI